MRAIKALLADGRIPSASASAEPDARARRKQHRVSIFAGWYVRTNADDVVQNYYYVSDSPPGQEYRLDGDHWVALEGIRIVRYVHFTGEIGYDRLSEPPAGLPNPPAMPAYDSSVGWLLPEPGEMVPPEELARPGDG